MLNIGPPELLLIIVIALVVVGPQRLPDLGRTIGRGLRELRKVQDEVRDMVDTGLDDDLKQTANELKQTASDLRKATDVRSAFRNTPHKARARAAAAVQEATTADPDEHEAAVARSNGDGSAAPPATADADPVEEPSDTPGDTPASVPVEPDEGGPEPSRG
jgi:Tat protein translocase TatB subunit